MLMHYYVHCVLSLPPDCGTPAHMNAEHYCNDVSTYVRTYYSVNKTSFLSGCNFFSLMSVSIGRGAVLLLTLRVLSFRDI